MNNQSFTTVLLLNNSPEEVFNAVTNVRGWWSEEIEGDTNRLNAVFYYQYEDIHQCQMKITEFVPHEKIVWYVVKNYFKFTKDTSEWTGTHISFEISKKENQTELTFIHHGLEPHHECYEICQDSWTNYIQNSLSNLIVEGKGKPNASGKPQTGNEKKLSSH